MVRKHPRLGSPGKEAWHNARELSFKKRGKIYVYLSEFGVGFSRAS